MCPVLKKNLKSISFYLHNILAALSAADFHALLDVMKVVLCWHEEGGARMFMKL
jgi:hypothetical protein